jgi:DNA repair exonuclease SbcCD ATPase subunit
MTKTLDEMSQEELLVEAKRLADEQARTAEALKKANAESASRRKQLQEEEAQRSSQLSEMEKLQKTVAELQSYREEAEADRQSRTIKSAVMLKIAEMGFAHPEDAFTLTDLSTVQVDGDKVTGFEESLKQLLESGRLPMREPVDGKSKAFQKTVIIEKNKGQPVEELPQPIARL